MHRRQALLSAISKDPNKAACNLPEDVRSLGLDWGRGICGSGAIVRGFPAEINGHWIAGLQQQKLFKPIYKISHLALSGLL